MQDSVLPVTSQEGKAMFFSLLIRGKNVSLHFPYFMNLSKSYFSKFIRTEALKYNNVGSEGLLSSIQSFRSLFWVVFSSSNLL